MIYKNFLADLKQAKYEVEDYITDSEPVMQALNKAIRIATKLAEQELLDNPDIFEDKLDANPVD